MKSCIPPTVPNTGVLDISHITLCSYKKPYLPIDAMLQTDLYLAKGTTLKNSANRKTKDAERKLHSVLCVDILEPGDHVLIRYLTQRRGWFQIHQHQHKQEVFYEKPHQDCNTSHNILVIYRIYVEALYVTSIRVLIASIINFVYEVPHELSSHLRH